MDFLDLAQELRKEASVAGTGPTTVVSQTGELGKLVGWINDAWEAIQNEKPDWRWMRADWSYAGSAADQEFTATDASITAFATWWPKTFRCYTTSLGVSDEQRITYKPWDEFRDTYLLGARPAASRPAHFTIKPDDSIMLGPIPDAAYTYVGEYQKAATRMAVDADVPTGLPSDLHMLIVWDALVLYGTFQGAPESVIRGNNNGSPIAFRLGRRKGMPIKFGGALA